MKRVILLLIVFYGLSGIITVSAQRTVGLLLNSTDAYDGYTLFTSSRTTYLIDNCGRLIHQWESDFLPGNAVYLLENGNLLRTARIPGVYNAGGAGGRIELFSWEGELLWEFEYSNDDHRQHHDIAYLPNGNILLIAWEGRTPQELIAAGRDINFVNNGGIWSEEIVEIEPTGSEGGNVVWKWQLWDHLVQDYDPNLDNYGIISDHPELVDINFEVGAASGQGTKLDWIHLNAVYYNEDLDQIVVSSRDFSEFWVIDHSTTTEEAAGHTGGNSGMGGDILYRWGNPQSYQRGDESDRKLYGQHDVQWIEEGIPGAGNLIMYNNGQNRVGGNFSTIDEIVTPLNENGTYDMEDDLPFGPVSPFWTYADDPPTNFFSSNISGVQRLPNGNTFICEGRTGRLFEVNNDGEKLWEYRVPLSAGGPIAQGNPPVNANIFRATRYGLDYPAFDGKDLTPGDPIELNPLPEDCLLTSDSEVFVPEHSSLIPLSNPIANNQIRLSNPHLNDWQLRFFTSDGQLIHLDQSNNETIEISCHDWPVGLYLLNAFDINSGKTVTLKLIK
jgi:hypothetical protein